MPYASLADRTRGRTAMGLHPNQQSSPTAQLEELGSQLWFVKVLAWAVLYIEARIPHAPFLRQLFSYTSLLREKVQKTRSPGRPTDTHTPLNLRRWELRRASLASALGRGGSSLITLRLLFASFFWALQVSNLSFIRPTLLTALTVTSCGHLLTKSPVKRRPAAH